MSMTILVLINMPVSHRPNVGYLATTTNRVLISISIFWFFLLHMFEYCGCYTMGLQSLL